VLSVHNVIALKHIAS